MCLHTLRRVYLHAFICVYLHAFINGTTQYLHVLKILLIQKTITTKYQYGNIVF